MIYLLLVVSILIHVRWLNLSGVFNQTDWPYNFRESLLELLQLPHLWTQNALGSIDITQSFYPLYLLYGFFAKTGLDFVWTNRILFLAPIVLLLPISSYILTKKIVRSNFAAAIGSAVYSYNTYIVSKRTDQLNLAVAFALAPLILVVFIKALEAKKLVYAVITGLLLFVMGFYEFRILYITCWLLFFYAIFYFFTIRPVNRKKNVAHFCVLVAVAFSIPILLNIYWIIGLSSTSQLLHNELFDRGLFGDSFLNILRAMTLFHPFWTGGAMTVFNVQPIPWYFFFIPVLAFIGLWFNRKNKDFLFFGILSIVGILLTKQAGEPFSGLYSWLYHYIPGFNAFREATKFYFVIALGYSVLIAGLVDAILKNKKYTYVQIGISSAVILLTIFLFIINTVPIFNGTLGGLLKTSKINGDYYIVKNFLLKQSDFSRTYWVPTQTHYAFYSQTHPVISGDILQYNWKDYLDTPIEYYLTKEQLISIFEKPYSANLFNNASIKYIVVPIDDRINDVNLFEHYKRSYFVDELKKIPFLKKINIGTNDIVAFENPTAKPHMYATLKPETVKNYVVPINIPFKEVSPTEYTFSITNLKSPIYINFSEEYHPSWKLRIGSFSWLSTLKKTYTFGTSIRNDAGLNSFIIDPNAIKKCDCTYTTNKDNSLNIKGTIYFAPQAYMYMAFIPSLLVFFICTVYLFFKIFIQMQSKK